MVALWMAGTLLAPPSGTPLQRLVQMAMERGYTAQGEMFSGELGAEGSQAGHSSPGRDWVGHCQVCGGTSFQSSFHSLHTQ